MIATINPDPTDHDETLHALKFAALASAGENVSKVVLGQKQTQCTERSMGSDNVSDGEKELLEEIYHLKLQLLDCERRRCATEAETRNAVCTELQLQAQKREAEYRTQLAEIEERARARAEKRFELWKRRMISGSDSTFDIEGAIELTKQKVEEDAERQLAKLRNQCEANQASIKESQERYEQLQNQLKVTSDERNAAVQYRLSHQNQLQSFQAHLEELTGRLDVAQKAIAERNAALEEQKCLNAALKQTIDSLKQQEAELEAVRQESKRKAMAAEKREASSKKRSEDKANALQKKIATLTSKVEKLQQELSEITSASSHVMESKEELESITSGLKSELDLARSKESQLVDDIQKLQDKIQVHIQKQGELEMTVSNLVSLSADQGSITSRLVKENDDLRRKLEQRESENAKALESNLQMLQEVEDLRLVLQKLQESQRDYESELRASNEEKDGLIRRFAELEADRNAIVDHNSRLFDQMTVRRQELEKEISALSGINEKHSDLKLRVKQLEDELKGNQEQLSRLVELESSGAQVQALQDENCSLKDEIAGLRKLKARELKELQKRIKQLESAAKKQDTKFEKDRRLLQKSLSSLESDKEKSVAEVNELKSELDSALPAIKKFEAECENLKSQVKAVEAFKLEAEEQKQLIEQLSYTISQQHAELEQSKKAIADKSQVMDASESSMQSRISDLCSKLNAYKEREVNLSSQLASITAEKNKLEQGVATSDIHTKDLQRKFDELQNQLERTESAVTEKKNLEKEIKQLQKKIASLEFQLTKKPRVSKETAALQDRIAQLEIEAAKYSDSQEEIHRLEVQISELKSKQESLDQLVKENEKMRQRIQDFETAAARRQQIELEKHVLQKRIAELESTEVQDLSLEPTETVATVDPVAADDTSLSAPPSFTKRSVFRDKSNRPPEAVKATRIISAGDQENVSGPRTFGKRSRAVLEENLKWSSILTSDPFDDIAKRDPSPELKRKPARKQAKEKIRPVASRRSMRLIMLN